MFKKFKNIYLEMTGQKDIVVRDGYFKKTGRSKSVGGYLMAKIFHDSTGIAGNGLYEEYGPDEKLKFRGTVITEGGKEYLDGPGEQYYPDGTIKAKGDVVKCSRFASLGWSTKRGIPTEFFYPNGQLSEKYSPDGSVVSYNPNGSIKRKGYYKNGKFYTGNKEEKEKNAKRQKALKTLEALQESPATEYRKAAKEAVAKKFLSDKRV